MASSNGEYPRPMTSYARTLEAGTPTGPHAAPASRDLLPRSGTLAPTPLLAAALLLALLIAAPAQAVVRRCIGPDGGTIYTDRPCDQFNAREQVPTPPGVGNEAILGAEDTGPVRSDCSRTPDALLFDLRRAVESSNINALAGLYHWPGTGGRTAVSIMNRLEDLTAEPGASIDLIYPEAAFVIDDPAAYPDLPVENPVGIRITRYVDADSERAPERSLGLRRHAGCWWIHF